MKAAENRVQALTLARLSKAFEMNVSEYYTGAISPTALLGQYSDLTAGYLQALNREGGQAGTYAAFQRLVTCYALHASDDEVTRHKTLETAESIAYMLERIAANYGQNEVFADALERLAELAGTETETEIGSGEIVRG